LENWGIRELVKRQVTAKPKSSIRNLKSTI
jgi:hypothetical protein